MDFGQGPPISNNGHFAIDRPRIVGIVALGDDIGLRVYTTKSGLERLTASPVYSALAPASGLMQRAIGIGKKLDDLGARPSF